MSYEEWLALTTEWVEHEEPGTGPCDLNSEKHPWRWCCTACHIAYQLVEMEDNKR